MATPTSFSNQNIDFIRLATLDSVTRPQPGLALYPQNSSGTVVSVNVTSTSISIRYISSSVQTHTISYIDKTAEEIALSINDLALPLTAVPTLRNHRFKNGDLFLYNNTSYFSIPEDFHPYDRIPENGILIRSNKFTVSHKRLVNFSLVNPYNSSTFSPWYPVITNGEFLYRDNSRTFRFSIPEFDKQVWSVKYGKPFKDVVSAKLKYLKPGAFKVDRTPIYWSGENIKLYNGDSLVPSSLIEDIDTRNGIIYTKQNSIITDETSIDYTYLEENFEYRDVNLNSHITQNPGLLDKFVILYAVPVEGIDYFVNKKAIHHIISDSVEEAINSIEQTRRDFPIVIIGGYNIQQVYTSDRISILDTRVLGGGLVSNDGPKSPVHYTDSIIDTRVLPTPVEDLIAESSSFFDIGTYDGRAYPGAGSVVMEFPNEIKDSLSESDIKFRSQKFLAAGIYPIVSYYDSPLPSVSGLSTQISMFMNGGMLESINGITGSCWHRFPIDLPGSPSSGVWSTQDDNLAPDIYKLDNTGVIGPSVMYGAFQTYLKSTPTAVIEYYTREHTLSANNQNDLNRYGPWKKIRIQDDREVPTGQLVKGYVAFPKSLNNVEYRSIKVHAPFRLDFTGSFKTDVLEEIEKIKSSLSGRTEEIKISGNMFYPMTTTYSSMSEQTSHEYPDFFGAPKPFDFLHDLMYSDVSASYSGMYKRMGDLISYSLQIDNKDYTGMFKFFDTASEEFRVVTETLTGLDMAGAIEQATKYGSWRKDVYGSNDLTYTGIRSKIGSIFNSHNITVSETKYPPSSYIYIADSDGGNVIISGHRHKIPEQSGFSSAEIYEGANNDFEYLASVPGLISTCRLVDNFTGSYANSIISGHASLWSGVSDAIERMPEAINGTRTNNGFQVANHWYLPYNRHGKYAGSLVNQLIDSYNHLYYSQSVCTGGLTWSGSPGLDVRTLATGFQYIEEVLSTALSGFSETCLRGGMLDRWTSDLLYGYGWYVVNRSTHTGHLYDYNSNLAGASINNYSNLFSGMFTSGMNILIKGSVTINGDLLETTIIDGDQGPFEVYTPSKIFKALSIGCQIDRNQYLPVAQAVFNTVKNNYSVNGQYYLDPLKSNDVPGHEDIIVSQLAKLYRSIQ